MVLNLLQLAAAFLLAFSTRSVLSSDDKVGFGETSSFSRVVQTTVINAFANVSVNAFVSFEGTQVNRVKYGQSRLVSIDYKQHDDFIILFRKEVTDELVTGLQDYGFLQEPATDYTQAYLIISYKPGNTQQAGHVFLTFDSSEVGEEFSKLYFFNGLTVPRDHPGVFVYALYLRDNPDGSQSETLTQLATGLGAGSGRDVDLEPSIRLQIKAFQSAITSIPEFKQGGHLVAYPDFLSLPGKRQLMVLHGHHRNTTMIPPELMLLAADSDINTATSTRSSLFVIFCLLFAVTVAI